MAPTGAKAAFVAVIGLSALLWLTAAAYSSALRGPFVFDDVPNIQSNDAVRLRSLSVGELWRACVDHPVRGRPVAHLSFALNYYFGGDEVFGYHAVNLLVHLAAGIVVYALSLATLRQYCASESPPPAWLDVRTQHFCALTAATIFTLHPIQTQAVSYVVQRMTSLGGLLYLSALLLYVVGRQALKQRRRIVCWLLGAVAWLLALGCKQNTVTLPAAVALYEWFFFQNRSLGWFGRRLWALSAGVLVIVGATAAQFLWIGGVFDHYENRDFTLAERLMTQTRVVCIYAKLVVLPTPGSYNLLHDVSTSHGMLDPPTTSAAFAAIAAYFAVAALTARRHRLISFCLWWLPLHLVVESSVLPLEMIYEHRMYLPMFGVSLAGGYGAGRLLAKRSSLMRWVALGTGAALLAGVDYQRNQVWSDPLLLWSDVLEKNPRCTRALVNRGAVFVERRRTASAAADYDRALTIDPAYDLAWIGRGLAAAAAGDHSQAVRDFNEALGLATSDAHRAIAYRARGRSLSATGEFDRAVRDFTLAMTLEPSDDVAQFNRGNAHRRAGRWREAKQDYLEVVQKNPGHAQAHNNLAHLLTSQPGASTQDVREGVEHAEEACKITRRQDWNMLDTLASAYAADGRWAAALEAMKQAIALAPAAQRSTLQRQQEQFRRRERQSLGR